MLLIIFVKSKSLKLAPKLKTNFKMKNILILGSGLSSYVMIEYLLNQCEANDWQIKVCDLNVATAQKIIGNNRRGSTETLDINDSEKLKSLISASDMVVSMLPARFHIVPARMCAELGKNMATASYVSPEMKELEPIAKQKGLIFMNEIGLDPGIDHMSAMQVIEHLKAQKAEIYEFRSFTGGLIAPKYDSNPWNYKFTWNPRNVVVAGQGTAQFLENGQLKYVPYYKLWERKDIYNVLNYGEFEGYPNRDSLKYRPAYGLNDVKTMIRGTLRRIGFVDSWNLIVQLGLTDDTFVVENSENMTYREFVNSFLPYHKTKSLEEKLYEYLNVNPNDYKLYRLRWLGLFENKKIGLKNATPAQILQKILEEKLVFEEGDKDLIAMQHIFKYKLNGKNYCLKSSFVFEGVDKTHSAMAITVGTPLAIAVKLVMQGKIKLTGVYMPTIPEIYKPVMEELKTQGIIFHEEIEEIAD